MRRLVSATESDFAMAVDPAQRRRKEMAISTQFRLIGQFVFTWNLFESNLNDAITVLCKLDSLHGLIVTANLNFQTKMHIFTTMVDYLGNTQSKDWIERAGETIAKIHTINSEWRTLVVHNLSNAIDTKSVRFLKVSAKRKLQWPKIIRSKTQFFEVYNALLSLGNEVKEIARVLADRPPSDLAKALTAQPIVPSYTPGLAGFPLPPLPTRLHSGLGLASLGTFFGTPANPPPKVDEEAKK
jgi:hypothetical protein